jgi:hypothetical protein
MLSAMGYENPQTTPGIFSSSLSMAAIKLFLVLVKAGAPFFLGFQIDKILCIEETGRVGSVVRRPV